ncbi:tRNA pseudouridine(54/55) synthase Pus10 [Methanosphaerula subterraneus]|uniref:tRNA pseudouridine(54/55) synthase Pus10 n=1 Tax=Methanosphaerula subterraneus TaxID=3350244 RepID=UPI003F877B3F
MIEQVKAILGYGEICDHCLGRFYGKLSFGLTNVERGHALRVAVALDANEPYHPAAGTCWVCNNLLDQVETWAERVTAALEGLEYSTFLIGTRVPPMLTESEEMVWSDQSLRSPEPLKSEMNREVGKAVSVRTGRVVDFKHPDVVVILDITGDRVEVQVNPVFIYGRYQKFERGIPQTHWDCRACHGRGCETCNFTGKQYADSVEELIGRPVMDALKATGAVLHGAGREDIDARMIGTGRPFILELDTPQIRSADLKELELAVNTAAAGRVAVEFDRWALRTEVETLKSNKAHKKYRILIEVEGDLSEDELNLALNRLQGVTIHQRTPRRVAHRRADKIRERDVLEIRCLGIEEGRYSIEVLGEAGLYIKELISGDDGRTRPSLTEILGRPAQVTSLDVVLVEEMANGGE